MPRTAYKRCSKCEAEKVLEAFYRAKKAKDGRQAYCKECARAVSLEHEKANPGMAARRTKEWAKRNPKHRARLKKESRLRNPKTRREAIRRERERYPEKYRARTTLGHAVERGRVVKPTSCEVCGFEPEDSLLIHGHHHDYSKPLEVHWLCHHCHDALHKGGLKKDFSGKMSKAQREAEKKVA